MNRKLNIQILSLLRDVGIAALYVALTTIIYYYAFQAPFQLDDFPTFVQNPSIRSFQEFRFIWSHDPSRFLTNLTFAFSYANSYLNPFAYHVFSFVLHLLVGFNVFVFVKLIHHQWEEITGEQAGSLSGMAALTALLFLIHPVQTSAVTYCAQRSTLLAALFYMLILNCYFIFRIKNRIGFYHLAIFLSALAIFTKPIIVTLPLTIILLEFSFLKPQKKQVKDLFLTLLPICLLVALIPVLLLLWKYKAFVLGQLPEMTRETVGISRKDYLLTQIHVLVTYIRICFLPIHLNLDYDYPMVTQFFKVTTIAKFSLLLFVLGLGVKCWKKYRIISFGIFWFFITLSLESSIFPISDVIFEHRLYLPIIGFLLIMPQVATMVLKDPKHIKIAVFFVVFIFSFLTFNRNIIWSDRIGFYLDAVKKSPNKVRVRNNLGLAFHREGRLEEAMGQYLKAIQLGKGSGDAFTNLGTVFLQQEKIGEALRSFDQAIRMNPQAWTAYNNRAIAYQRKDRPDLAINDLKVALKLNPFYAEAYFNLGTLLQEKGRYEKALSVLSKSVLYDPLEAKAYYHRGQVYYYLGEFESSLKDFEQALALNYDEVKILNNRGVLYSKLDKFELALKDFNTLIALDPRSAEGYHNRGGTYKEMKRLDLALKDFNKAIALNSDYADAYFNRGDIYKSKGLMVSAFEDFLKVKEINPQNVQVYFEIAHLYLLEENLGKALDYYGQILIIDPQNAKAHNARGKIYYVQKNFDQAILELNQAISLNGKYAQAYFFRSLCYKEMGKTQKAVVDLKKADQFGMKITDRYWKELGKSTIVEENN